MKIHVIIVTFNGMTWLAKCLSSLTTSLINLDVIIVDNNSTDGSQEFIKKEFPQFRLIETQLNSGFGKANNIGIKVALEEDTDGIFLLNQDAYIDSNTISYLHEVSQNCDDFGILSPIHMDGSCTQVDVGFSKYLSKAKTKRYVNNFDNEISYLEVPFINAAAWYIPRRTLRQVGGFDPLFPHYGEDKDYCNRVSYNKLKIVVLKEVRVCHDRVQIESKDVKKNMVKFLNGTFVNYLSLAKKPSDSNALSFVKVLLYGLFNILRAVLKFEFCVCLCHYNGMKKVLWSFRAITSSKKITRKQVCAFVCLSCTNEM
jgi:GT2 family glycosyltransferase